MYFSSISWYGTLKVSLEYKSLFLRLVWYNLVVDAKYNLAEKNSKYNFRNILNNR